MAKDSVLVTVRPISLLHAYRPVMPMGLVGLCLVVYRRHMILMGETKHIAA